MAFSDYSGTPASNTTLSDGTYVGPNMLRNKVRPAFQQLMADGKLLADEVEDIIAFPQAATSLNRAAVASLSNPASKNIRYLAEAGREGIFIFDTANLSAMVTADTQQGVYIAPASDTDGSSGAWVRQFDGPALSTWFGVSTAGTAAANTTAFNAALALCAAADIRHLHTPDGTYLFNAVIDITAGPIELSGTLPNPYTEEGTTFSFTGNTTGIRVQGYGTSGATTSGGVTIGATGTSIHNLRLVGAFTAAQSDAHGIHYRGKVSVRDVRIESFSGDGLHGIADFGASNGNINGSEFRNVTIFSCRRGNYTNGLDGNNVTFDNVSCFSNRQTGHDDQSLLGNIYRGGDCTDNGNNASFPTRATYSGNVYAVAQGQEVGAKTNAPSGTTAHNTWWIYLGASGSITPATAWVNGATDWYFSAPFTSYNANARSRFADIYSEIAQNPCVVNTPAIVYAGFQGSSVIYPDGDAYDAMLYSATGALGVQGSLNVGGNLTVANPTYFVGGSTTFGPAGAPWSGIIGTAGTFYIQGPNTGNIIFRNQNSGVVWGTLDETGLDLPTGRTIRINGTSITAPSIQSVVSAATVTPTFLNDQVNITAQAAALNLANPTGTAVDGWGIVIRIKDNGTARAITYGAQYRAVGVTLPTTTVANKTLYLGGIWNAADSKLDVTAVAAEA